METKPDAGLATCHWSDQASKRSTVATKLFLSMGRIRELLVTSNQVN